MDRLTQWFDKKVAGIAASLEEKHTAEQLIDILANRLAAYEDTGLEPETIISAKEMAEIAVAMTMLRKYQGIGTVQRFQELVETVGTAPRIGWTAMVDEPPPKSGSYIVCTKLGAVCTATYNEKTRRFGHSFYGVTHWMHRPLPPKEKTT